MSEQPKPPKPPTPRPAPMPLPDEKRGEDGTTKPPPRQPEKRG